MRFFSFIKILFAGRIQSLFWFWWFIINGYWNISLTFDYNRIQFCFVYFTIYSYFLIFFLYFLIIFFSPILLIFFDIRFFRFISLFELIFLFNSFIFLIYIWLLLLFHNRKIILSIDKNWFWSTKWHIAFAFYFYYLLFFRFFSSIFGLLIFVLWFRCGCFSYWNICFSCNYYWIYCGLVCLTINFYCLCWVVFNRNEIFIFDSRFLFFQIINFALWIILFFLAIGYVRWTFDRWILLFVLQDHCLFLFNCTLYLFLFFCHIFNNFLCLIFFIAYFFCLINIF